MKQSLGLAAIVVRDYDEAINFYVGTLGFDLVEDTAVPEQAKRWVVVAPQGSTESNLLLARAVGEEQASRIGNQTGGRVLLFLHTDDFWRDYHTYKERGVVFVRDPKEETYGTVAVFRDLYGNLWDLLQPKRDAGESGAEMQIRSLTPDDYTPPDPGAGPVWGETVDGLQLAVSGIRQDRHFKSGDPSCTFQRPAGAIRWVEKPPGLVRARKAPRTS